MAFGMLKENSKLNHSKTNIIIMSWKELTKSYDLIIMLNFLNICVQLTVVGKNCMVMCAILRLVWVDCARKGKRGQEHI